MAVEYIAGSLQTFDFGGAAVSLDNANTVSTAITVPADATMVIVGISAWKGFTNNYYSDGSMTFTKNGIDTAMTAVQPTPRADTTAVNHNAAMFYMTLPDTGTNKTCKWDWVGSSSQDRGMIASMIFLKGVDTSDPVRGTGGGLAALPVNTGTITAISGDLIVAFVGISLATPATEATIDSWSNLTLLSQIPDNHNFTDGAWATGTPTGDTTVGAITGTTVQYAGIVAVSLKPAVSSSFPAWINPIYLNRVPTFASDPIASNIYLSDPTSPFPSLDVSVTLTGVQVTTGAGSFVTNVSPYSVTAGSTQTVYGPKTLPDDDTGGNLDVNIRFVIPGSQMAAFTGTPTQFRISVQFGPNQTNLSQVLTDCFAGRGAPAGDAYDFANSPARVTFAGVNYISPTGANYTITSDWINLPETYDETKPFVLSYHFSATNDAHIAMDAATPSGAAYFKYVGNEAATQDVSGYSSFITDGEHFVTLIEMKSPDVASGLSSLVTAYAGTLTVNTAVGSPDINVAITGISGQVLAGSLFDTLTEALPGATITLTAGTTTERVNTSISTSVVTISAGNDLISLAKILSGVASTISAGNLTATIQIPTIGASLTINAGSNIESFSKILTGISTTLNAGTLSDAEQSSVTGSGATLAAGLEIAQIIKTLIGASAALSAGSFTFSFNITLNGTAVTINAGTDIGQVIGILTTVGATLSAGSFLETETSGLTGAQIIINAGLSYEQANTFTSAATVTIFPGTLTATTASQSNTTLTGSTVTLGAGTDLLSLANLLTGVSSTISAGALTVAIQIPTIGASVTVNAGSSSEVFNKLLVGISTTLNTGTLSDAEQFIATGASTTLSAGLEIAQVIKLLTGASITSSAGSLTFALNVTTLNGATVTLNVGTNLEQITELLTTVGATLSAGLLSDSEQFGLTGAQSSISTSTLVGIVQAIIISAAVTGQAGSYSFSMVDFLTGTQVTVNAGTLTIQTDSSVTISITGVQAVTFAGSLVETITKALTGTSATALAGTEIGMIPEALIGANVTTLSGTDIAALTKILTGANVSLSAGTDIAAITKLLIGANVSLSAGNDIAQITKALIGASVTPSPGLLLETIAKQLTGAVCTLNATSPSFIKIDVFLPSSFVTATAGPVQATGASLTSVNITGVSANALATFPSIAITKALLAGGVTLFAGDEISRITPVVIGAGLSISAGSVLQEIIKTVLTTVTTISAGTLRETIAPNLIGSGIIIDASPLNLTLNIPLSGLITTSSGSISFETDKDIFGVSATVSASSPFTSLNAFLIGADATIAAGTIPHLAQITGASVSALTNSLTQEIMKFVGTAIELGAGSLIISGVSSHQFDLTKALMTLRMTSAIVSTKEGTKAIVLLEI